VIVFQTGLYKKTTADKKLQEVDNLKVKLKLNPNILIDKAMSIFHSSDHTVKEVVDLLELAKEKDPKLKDRCNELIAMRYRIESIQYLKNIDSDNADAMMEMATKYMNKAMEYLGNYQKFAYKDLIDAGDKAMGNGKLDVAEKLYKLAKKYE